MIDRIRDAVERASKTAEAPRRRAEGLARDLVRDLGKGPRGSNPSGLADRVLRQAREYSETARSLMTSEIRRQLRRMGLATTEEVERLTSRIAELEARAGAPAPEASPVRRRRPSATSRPSKPGAPSGDLPSPEELAEKKVRRSSRAAAAPKEATPSGAAEGAPRPPARRRARGTPASGSKPAV
jgi:cell division septum initiation protein DivIVA